MFEFTLDEFKSICDKAMLNGELKQIFEMKIKGYSIVQMAIKLNMSESTVNRRVNRRIKQLKKKIMKVI